MTTTNTTIQLAADILMNATFLLTKLQEEKEENNRLKEESKLAADILVDVTILLTKLQEEKEENI